MENTQGRRPADDDAAQLQRWREPGMQPDKKKKNLGLQGRVESAVRGESHTISIINKPMKFEKKENHTSFDIFPVVTHFYNKYTSQHMFLSFHHRIKN